MKIPKRVEHLLKMKCIYAEKLNSAEVELDRWLESKGISLDEPELEGCLVSGIMIYAEPRTVYNKVKEYIENFNG